jgi:hypothetical protein
MYYNSNTSKFRCYEAGTWKDCITLDVRGANNTFTGTQSFTGATFAISGSPDAAKFNVANLFNVDSSASKVTIGASDTTGTLFVLDDKTGAGDPTGTGGGMYYNSNTGKLRCYQGGAWYDCVGLTVTTNADTLDTLDSTAFAQLAANNAFTGSTFSVDGAVNAAKFNVGSIFNVDTTNSIVSIGAADATGTVFVFDTKNTAGDPTGSSATNGAMYYNSSKNKFRCYENGAWKDCIGGPPSLRSFVDSTADAIVDANTTNYWDIAAENNNTTPNITLGTTTNQVLGIVTVETTSSGTQDLEVSTHIERGIGSVPTCGSGSSVGGNPGTFSSNSGTVKSSTINFIDSPNTASPVYYTLCSDSSTSGTTGTISRIRITLQEVINSN